MKYTKEQKLKWAEDFNAGRRIETPPGVSRQCLMNQIREWARSLREGGPESLGRKPARKFSLGEKLAAVKRLSEGGASLREIAKEVGCSAPTISIWAKSYREKGAFGLQSPEKGPIVVMAKGKTQVSLSEREELELLRKRNAYLETENAYLKKLDALVRERELGLSKARKRRRSTSSGRRDSD